MAYFRKNIDAMSGYEPGEQPPPGSVLIKLNTNENPYLPSPAVLNTLQKLDGEILRRYPDPTAERFRQSASKALSISPDWILVGNGSDDLLTMIVRACTEPNRKIVYPIPTYVLYRTLAQIQDAKLEEITYNEDFNLPRDQLLEADGAVTFIASPNSPSGHTVSIELLDQLAAHLSGVLVIDEAYIDFAEANSLELVQKHSNVVVLRTLSKGYSLAGLRLGFAVANPELLAGLIKVKDSYNVDAVACILGAAAIEDQSYKITNAERIKTSRGKMASDLKQLGLRVWPSQANFLLVQPPGDAKHLYHALKAQGILVRYFQQPLLEDKLRITVGTDEQNDILIRVLAELLL